MDTVAGNPELVLEIMFQIFNSTHQCSTEDTDDNCAKVEDEINEDKNDDEKVKLVCSLARIKYKIDEDTTEEGTNVGVTVNREVKEKICISPDWCGFSVSLSDGDYLDMSCGIKKVLNDGGWQIILILLITIVVLIGLVVGFKWAKAKFQTSSDQQDRS